MHAVLDAIVSVGELWLDSELEWQPPLSKKSYEPMFALSSVLRIGGRATGIVALSFERETAQFAARTISGRVLRELPDLAGPVELMAQMIGAEAESTLWQLGTRIEEVTVVIGRSRCLEFPVGVRPLCIPFNTSAGRLAVEFGLVEGSTGAGDGPPTVDGDTDAGDEVVLD